MSLKFKILMNLVILFCIVFICLSKIGETNPQLDIAY